MRNKFFRNFDFDKYRAAINSKEEVVKVFNQLYQIRWEINKQDEIKFFLESNNNQVAKRKEILLKFIAAFLSDVSVYTVAILFFLIQEGSFQKLGYFINVLKIYFAQEANLMMVEVISRFDIEENNLKIYKASLEFIYQKEVEYIFRERESLIGGFILRWHTGEIDLSVKRKLKKMKLLIEQGR